jgi:hypothetical protein
MLQNVKVAVILIAYLLLISLPGLAVALIGWHLSHRIRPVSVQVFCRAGLIAAALTPSFYGHAGLIPAVVLVFIVQGRERLAGILPIIIVWVIALLVIGVRAKGPGLRVRYVDEACAWLLFLAGALHIVLTELCHFQGTLDTALVWLLAAMLNLLRVRGHYSVRLPTSFCAAANLAVLALEAVRWKMFQDPLSLMVLALSGIESVLSMRSSFRNERRMG